MNNEETTVCPLPQPIPDRPDEVLSCALFTGPLAISPCAYDAWISFLEHCLYGPEEEDVKLWAAKRLEHSYVHQHGGLPL